jgi:hypothetical protein
MKSEVILESETMNTDGTNETKPNTQGKPTESTINQQENTSKITCTNGGLRPTRQPKNRF